MGRCKYKIKAINLDKQLFIMGKPKTWLAVKCGISISYLSQLTSHIRHPSAPLGKKLCMYTRMKFDDLFDIEIPSEWNN